MKTIKIIIACLITLNLWACKTYDIYSFRGVKYRASELSEETIEWINDYAELEYDEKYEIPLEEIPDELYDKYAKEHIEKFSDLDFLPKDVKYYTIVIHVGAEDPVYVYYDDPEEVAKFTEQLNNIYLWKYTDFTPEYVKTDVIVDAINSGQIRRYSVWTFSNGNLNKSFDIYRYDGDGYYRYDIYDEAIYGGILNKDFGFDY